MEREGGGTIEVTVAPGWILRCLYYDPGSSSVAWKPRRLSDSHKVIDKST